MPNYFKNVIVGRGTKDDIDSWLTSLGIHVDHDDQLIEFFYPHRLNSRVVDGYSGGVTIAVWSPLHNKDSSKAGDATVRDSVVMLMFDSAWGPARCSEECHGNYFHRNERCSFDELVFCDMFHRTRGGPRVWSLSILGMVSLSAKEFVMCRVVHY